jgi:signal transduction histidine kinase
MLRKISLTPKTLLIAFLAALAVWSILDRQQSNNIQTIFFRQFDKELTAKAEQDRNQFDRYLQMHLQTLRIIGLQARLQSHLADMGKSKQVDAGHSRYYTKEPPWFPPRSVLRPLIVIRYLLLFDEDYQPLEVFQKKGARPLPEQLLHPSLLIRQVSLNQLYMTDINNFPYVISSIQVPVKNDAVNYTLMIISPLDDEFLQDSQVMARQNSLVALIDPKKKSVLASDHPESLPRGTSLSTVQQNYKVLGKSFFDYGASSLQVQFSSMLSLHEYEEISREFLSQERYYRFILASVLLVVFLGIIFWVTRHIKMLTRTISKSAHEAGIQLGHTSKGDEFVVLQESFNHFSSEIMQSRKQLFEEKIVLKKAQEKLTEKNEEISTNRKKLQDALENISSLIRQTTRDGSFQVRFDNKAVTKCYEATNCQEKGCPCYGKEAMRCWLETPTSCTNRSNGFMVGQKGDCFECPVFKSATEDPIVLVGEQFNSMMHILENKNRDLLAAYDELKTAQSQLLQKEKMASVGQLAAGIAHEINNPIAFVSSNLTTLGKYLTRLGGFIEVIEKEFLPPDDENTANLYAEKRKKHKLAHILQDGAELIKESHEGIYRVQKIVETLKEFSGIDQAEKRFADINECIALTLEIVKKELKDTITINTDLVELPLVKCFPHKLNQVFLNIILNAVNAIDDTGTIYIQTGFDKGNIYIEIRDTGHGIPKESLPRIFEPFYTTKDVGQGTGLGLSMSYDIITEHGGVIEAESAVGEGSTFRIILPAAH